MFRKANGRRQVLQKGAQKKQFERAVSKIKITSQMKAISSGKYQEKLYKFSDNCFKLLGHYCCKLCFVPLSVNSEGKYTMKESLWGMVLHYSILGLQCVRILHHCISIVTQASSGQLDLTMILCISSLLIYTTGIGMSASILFKRYETIQMLNTLPIIMNSYSRTGRKLGVLEDPKCVLIVTTSIAMGITISLVMPACTLLVESLPVSLSHIFKLTGAPLLCPWMPSVLWKLMFWPVETPMYLHSMMIGVWTSLSAFAFVNVAATCTANLRELPRRTLSDWMKLRRHYLAFQVFVKLCNSWVKFMIVPTVTLFSASIIICLYTAIRHTELPLLLYLCVLFVGLQISVVTFDFTFQLINTVAESESVVGLLAKALSENYSRLSVRQRLYQKKVLRATRAVVLHYGNFAEFSVGVPVGIAEEIINQLLFLLTLLS